MPSVGLDAIADSVARGSAVVLTLAVAYGAWPKTGIVDAPAGRKTPGAHAVLAVGTATLATDIWVTFKNSWGTGWGVDGYGFVSPRYLDHYVRAAHVLEPAA
jgi:C1A family cysteine protease